MALWLQNILVFVVVAACAGLALWQGLQAIRGKSSGLGGCGTCKSCHSGSPKAVGAPARVVFLPVEMLRKRR